MNIWAIGVEIQPFYMDLFQFPSDSKPGQLLNWLIFSYRFERWIALDNFNPTEPDSVFSRFDFWTKPRNDYAIPHPQEGIVLTVYFHLLPWLSSETPSCRNALQAGEISLICPLINQQVPGNSPIHNGNMQKKHVQKSHTHTHIEEPRICMNMVCFCFPCQQHTSNLPRCDVFFLCQISGAKIEPLRGATNRVNIRYVVSCRNDP